MPHLLSRRWGGIGSFRWSRPDSTPPPLLCWRALGSHQLLFTGHQWSDHLRLRTPFTLPSLPSAFSNIIVAISPYQTGGPAGGPPWISHRTVKWRAGSQTGPVPKAYSLFRTLQQSDASGAVGGNVLRLCDSRKKTGRLALINVLRNACRLQH